MNTKFDMYEPVRRAHKTTIDPVFVTSAPLRSRIWLSVIDGAVIIAILLAAVFFLSWVQEGDIKAQQTYHASE